MDLYLAKSVETIALWNVLTEAKLGASIIVPIEGELKRCRFKNWRLSETPAHSIQ